METIEYKLASVPGESVLLPLESVKMTDKLMELVKDCKTREELYDILQSDVSFKGLEFTERLLRRTDYLRNSFKHSNGESPRALTFKDRLYLDNSEYKVSKETGSYPESVESILIKNAKGKLNPFVV